ncbi:hypothetical protein AAT19DRAFT_12840 [Rhodotorula toruloides]|uniref:Uncharacterized protein n=1 Tax=Rhodotorula toruloides TaxID=5286 RepID=A0A2T0ACS7_RHOTO|nr:hypothetical protein AAT19DRAFT_12840 [Rhodotorula toruloides]
MGYIVYVGWFRPGLRAPLRSEGHSTASGWAAASSADAQARPLTRARLANVRLAAQLHSQRSAWRRPPQPRALSQDSPSLASYTQARSRAGPSLPSRPRQDFAFGRSAAASRRLAGPAQRKSFPLESPKTCDSPRRVSTSTRASTNSQTSQKARSERTCRPTASRARGEE